jgi:sulfopyruvate decarboxylase subunit alpha
MKMKEEDIKMKDSAVKLVIEGLKEAGVDTIVALPDSRLKELYPALANDPYFRYIPVTNEGEGVSIVAGVMLGGRGAVMLMENSGLRVAIEALSRLGYTHEIPVFMMMSYVGDIGEINWWGISHGLNMEPLLEAMRIPYTIVRKNEEIKDTIIRSKHHTEVSKYHVAIVLSGEVTSSVEVISTKP